ALFDLNALTVNNTSGIVTIAGNPLNFTGTNPTVTVAGGGSMVLSPSVSLTVTTAVAGTGTGSLPFRGGRHRSTNRPVMTSAGSLTLAGGGSLDTLILQAGSTGVTGGTLALTAPGGFGNFNAGLDLGTADGQTVVLNQTGGRINVTENVFIGDS